MNNQIFVSVAAYADSQLEPTLRYAMAQAEHPERLVFGILNQTSTALTDHQLLCRYPVRLLQITPQESYGVSWARAVIQTLYDNEPYYLQIDSHMYFAPGWDRILIDMLSRLPSERSILSVYPYGYTREGEEIHFDCPVSPDTTLVTRPLADQILRPEDYTLRFQTKHFLGRDPILGCHLAAGFLFSPGTFIQEIPYDPQYYFHGEEQALSLRAFTHGWDIYHPPEIPLYHWYKPANQETTGHHWHKKWQRPPEQVAWLEERARVRLKNLVENRIRGVFGLGNIRSLADFAKMSGIDYANCTIEDPAHLRGLLL